MNPRGILNGATARLHGDVPTPAWRQVTCNANDGTLNRSVPLDLNPIASSTRHIRTIESLGDDAFKSSDRQPRFRDVNVGRMSHQLQAWVLSVKQVLENSASLDVGQRRQ